MNTNKKKMGMLVAVGMVTGATVWAGEPDFSQLNPVLQGITDQVTHGDDLVGNAEVKFDAAFTHLSREQLAYEARSKLKQAPWGSDASLQARAEFRTERGALPGIDTRLAASVDTDTLALSRYAARVALKNVRGHDPRFEARVIGNLTRLAQVSSMGELARLLEESRSLAIEMIEARLARLQQPADAHEIQQWKSVRESYRASKVSIDSHGQIRVTSAAPAGFLARKPGDVDARKAEVAMSASQVSAELSVFVRRSQSDLDQLKLELNDALKGIEAGSPKDKAEAESAYREALIAFKRVARGQNSY